MFSLYEISMPSASIIANRLSLPAVTRFGTYPKPENWHQCKEKEERQQKLRDRLLQFKDSDEASQHESDHE